MKKSICFQKYIGTNTNPHKGIMLDSDYMGPFVGVDWCNNSDLRDSPTLDPK